jgi:hypothetical protein
VSEFIVAVVLNFDMRTRGDNIFVSEIYDFSINLAECSLFNDQVDMVNDIPSLINLVKNIKHFFIFGGVFSIYDMPLPKYLLFQDPATIAMLNIINFHHDLF